MFPAQQDQIRKCAILNNLEGAFVWRNESSMPLNEKLVLESRILSQQTSRISDNCDKMDVKSRPSQNPID
jgi:hypothetical protein